MFIVEVMLEKLSVKTCDYSKYFMSPRTKALNQFSLKSRPYEKSLISTKLKVLINASRHDKHKKKVFVCDNRIQRRNHVITKHFGQNK